MLSHVKSGVCHLRVGQPAIVTLPEPGTCLPYDDLYKSESPCLTVICDTESRLLPPPEDMSSQDKVAADENSEIHNDFRKF